MPITVNPSPVTQHLSLITVIITCRCHPDCHHPPSLSPPPTTFTIAYHHHHLLSLSPVTCRHCCHHLPLLSPLLSNPITCHHYHCYCDCPPSPVMVTCYCHWSLVVVTMTVHYQHHPSSLTITCHKAVLNYALAHAVTPSQLSTSTFSQLSSLIFLELCNENCSKILVIFIQ